MRISRFPMLLAIASLSGLLSTAAIASRRAPRTLSLLDQAQIETQAIEDILQQNNSRRAKRQLLRRVNRLENLLVTLETQLQRERRARRSRVAQEDNFSGIILIEDPIAAPIDLPQREVQPGSFAYNGNSETSKQELKQILKALEAEAFSDSRLEALSSAKTGRTFTVNQVKTIVDSFSFGDDKVDAAAMLFDHVSDPENWFAVYDSLPFDSDRKALRKRTQ